MAAGAVSQIHVYPFAEKKTSCHTKDSLWGFITADDRAQPLFQHHARFIHDAVHGSLAGYYSRASSSRPNQTCELDCAWLKSAATAALDLNPNFISCNPLHPIVFHPWCSRLDQARTGRSTQSVGIPLSARLYNSQIRASEDVGQDILTMFGLQYSDKGELSYKTNTLVPGLDGTIRGRKAPNGRTILDPNAASKKPRALMSVWSASNVLQEQAGYQTEMEAASSGNQSPVQTARSR